MEQTKRKVTILDVAQMAGVSKATISYYLNGKYHAMSEETKKKIELAIETVGYQPKVSKKKTKEMTNNKLIGLIISDITDPFCSSLCKGIFDATSRHGYEIMIANTDNNRNKENEYVQSFIARGISGMIINTVGNNDEELVKVYGQVPIVLADRKMETLIYDTVSSNNYEAIQECLEYIVDRQYNEIALFTEEPAKGTARSIRYRAFQDFTQKYQESDIRFSIHEISIFDYGDTLTKFISYINENKERKKAIIGVNGNTLLSLLRCTNNLSLKVPKDLGICGYDDFAWAPLVQNGITTISQPTYEMGYTCVEKIIKQIESQIQIEPTHLELRSKMEIRGSI